MKFSAANRSYLITKVMDTDLEANPATRLMDTDLNMNLDADPTTRLNGDTRIDLIAGTIMGVPIDGDGGRLGLVDNLLYNLCIHSFPLGDWIQLIQLCIDNDAELEFVYENRWDEVVSALHAACQNPDVPLEVIQCLVSNGADVQHNTHRWNKSPLTLVCEREVPSAEIIQYLISNGADVNHIDGVSRTPLTVTMEYSDSPSVIDAIFVLIENGADTNIRSRFVHFGKFYKERIDAFCWLLPYITNKDKNVAISGFHKRPIKFDDLLNSVKHVSDQSKQKSALYKDCTYIVSVYRRFLDEQMTLAMCLVNHRAHSRSIPRLPADLINVIREYYFTTPQPVR